MRDEIVKERERKISNLRESEASTETGDKDRARGHDQQNLDLSDIRVYINCFYICGVSEIIAA